MIEVFELELSINQSINHSSFKIWKVYMQIYFRKCSISKGYEIHIHFFPYKIYVTDAIISMSKNIHITNVYKFRRI